MYPERVFFNYCLQESIKNTFLLNVNNWLIMLTPKIRGTSKSIIWDGRHRPRRRWLVSCATGPAPSACWLGWNARSVILTSALRLRQHLYRLLSFRATLSAGIFTSHNFCARLLARHDVQEAEEGELQRAGDWTRVSGQRHLFPFVKVRQLQDGGLPEQLPRSLQLQNFGLFWRDSAQKPQEGNNSHSKQVSTLL